MVVAVDMVTVYLDLRRCVLVVFLALRILSFGKR